MYLVFEFMEADLHNVIKKLTILKDIHKQFIMCQLFRAVRFLHSGNVLHRFVHFSILFLFFKTVYTITHLSFIKFPRAYFVKISFSLLKSNLAEIFGFILFIYFFS